MKKIFFIDDNHNLCIIWKLLFERFGYDIEVFEDAERALEMIEQSGQPDAIITDYNLPGMNGIELLDSINSIIERPLISIILTGDKEKLVNTMNLPKNYIVLSKPIKFEEVKDIIESNDREDSSSVSL